MADLSDQTAWARELYFLPADEAALTQALKVAFPRVIFTKTITSEKPELKDYGSIQANSGREVDILVSGEGWVPEFAVKTYESGKFWYLVNAPYWAMYQPGRLTVQGPTKRGWRVESLEQGRLLGAYRRGDKEGAAFARKARRIVGTLATNRLKEIDPSTGKVHRVDEKGGMFWAGHHAVRWCCAGARRYFAYGRSDPRFGDEEYGTLPIDCPED